MPRAYMAMILSSNPVKRRSCLGMSSGSKLESRSRGTSMRSGPSSVNTVLPLVPLRWLLTASSLTGSVRAAKVVAKFGPEGALDQRLLTAIFFLLVRRHPNWHANCRNPLLSQLIGASLFQKIALSHCRPRQVAILDMVGVVGSSPIAPTKSEASAPQGAGAFSLAYHCRRRIPSMRRRDLFRINKIAQSPLHEDRRLYGRILPHLAGVLPVDPA